MAVYTVHEPTLRDGETGADPMQFRFVRDGFYVWAFLLGPIWMFWHGLWLVLLIYLVATAALHAGIAVVGLSGPTQVMAGLLVAILVGIEAGSLRRWSLGRRWTQVGLVIAPNRELAEHRFFESWAGSEGRAAPVRPAPPVLAAIPPAANAPIVPQAHGSQVLGLFPQPDSRR